MMDFIEMLRTKPEHVRKQVALLASGSITGVVAIAWVVALMSSGTLSLSPTGTRADDTFSAAPTSENPASALIGAFGALKGAASGGPISVVEVKSSSTLDTKAPEERTVIPF